MVQVVLAQKTVKGGCVSNCVAVLVWTALFAACAAFQPLPATCPYVEPPSCEGRAPVAVTAAQAVDTPTAQQAATVAHLTALAQQHSIRKAVPGLARDITEDQDDDIQAQREATASADGMETVTNWEAQAVASQSAGFVAPDTVQSAQYGFHLDQLDGSTSPMTGALDSSRAAEYAVPVTVASLGPFGGSNTTTTAVAVGRQSHKVTPAGDNVGTASPGMANNLATVTAISNASTDTKGSTVAEQFYYPGHGNGPSRNAGPTQVQPQLTFLQNAKFKLGIDLDRAGVIAWLSSTDMPEPWKDENLINVWDQGRLLQQSLYGCVDGSCWAGRPWLYNPVQGGSWENVPSVTTKHSVRPNRAYVEGHPRNWGKQNLIEEVTFTSDIRLRSNFISVKFGVQYSGNVTHPYMTQEVPAVFVDRRFSVLTYYAGNQPWTNDGNISYSFPGPRNMYVTPTERWAAYLDPETGWGIGVYSPIAWLGITAYRVGPDGSTAASDCSYFAHTIRMQLHPAMEPFYYQVYIAVGHLKLIREIFRRIAMANA